MFFLRANDSERLYIRLLKRGIPLLVLVACALLVPRIAARPSYAMLLLAAAGLALGAVLLIRMPALGLAGIIVGGLIIPFAIGTGSESSINPAMLLTLALTGLWLLGMVLRRDLVLASAKPITPALAFCFLTLLAFIGGSQPLLGLASTAPLRAQIGGLMIFVLSPCAFLLAAHQIRKLEVLERLTWLFFVLAAVYIVLRLQPGLYARVPWLFPSGSTGALFWTWLVALAAGQLFFNKTLGLAARIFLALLLACTLYVALLVSRDWSSGWLPPLVALLVIGLIGAPRLALPLTLAAGVAGLIYSRDVIAAVMIGDNNYSLFTRLVAWQIIWEIIKINPVLGLGPANYYWYTPLFPILGYAVTFNSHNNYVDMLAQVGIVGFACFVWFAYRTWRFGWDLRRHAPDGFARAYVYSALGGLAATLVAGMLGDWILPFVYNIGFNGFRASVLGWLFLGGLVAIQQIGLRQAAAVPEQP